MPKMTSTPAASSERTSDCAPVMYFGFESVISAPSGRDGAGRIFKLQSLRVDKQKPLVPKALRGGARSEEATSASRLQVGGSARVLLWLTKSASSNGPGVL